MHFNAVDYNSTLDQLIISCPTLNEVWIIDHSTTSAEVSGHTGGISGKGGDLLYRWGNPASYRRGTPTDQTLGFQHAIRWLDNEEELIDENDRGKLMLFNNVAAPNTSSVNTLLPVFDTLTKEYEMEDSIFLPKGFDYSYTTPDPARMYSRVVSNAQLLPNGNTLVCAGAQGYIFEKTTDDQIVWEYIVPFDLGVPVSQGSTIPLNRNLTFRAYKYSTNWSGFVGKSFSNLGPLELNPGPSNCTTSHTLGDHSSKDISFGPNPTNGMVSIHNLPKEYYGSTITVCNVLGKKVMQINIEDSSDQVVDFSDLKKGKRITLVYG